MRNPAAQGRPDANHAEIVGTYEALFCSVFDGHSIGFGFPDLIIGCAGITALVEVKSEEGELRASQRTFARDWRGSRVRIVRTPQDVVEHVQEIRQRQAGVLK